MLNRQTAANLAIAATLCLGWEASTATAGALEDCLEPLQMQAQARWTVSTAGGVGLHDGGFVLFDPLRGEMERRSPAGDPIWETQAPASQGFGGIAVGESALWILDRLEGTATAYEIETGERGEVAHQPPLWEGTEAPPSAWPVAYTVDGLWVMWVPVNPGSARGGAIVVGRAGGASVDTIVQVAPSDSLAFQAALAVPEPVADFDRYAVDRRRGDVVVVRQSRSEVVARRLDRHGAELGTDTLGMAAPTAPAHVLDTLDGRRLARRQNVGASVRVPDPDEAWLRPVRSVRTTTDGVSWLALRGEESDANRWYRIDGDHEPVCLVLAEGARIWDARGDHVWTIRSESFSSHDLVRHAITDGRVVR